MSGPYCKTCEYFYPAMLSKEKDGACLDPSKRISVKCGDYVNSEPHVYEFYECCNHSGLNQPKAPEVQE